MPEATDLVAQIRKAHQGPKTLSCEGKAFVEAPENGGRYALHVSVERPGSIRLEALTPIGDPAAVLVATGGRFALMDLRNNVFYRGPATPENLSRLIPAPLTAPELVALITGDVPEAPGGQQPTVKRDGDGYLLDYGSQKVKLGADLRVLEVRRPTWSVTLDEHDDSSGAQVPRLIHLDAPGARTRVDLRLRNSVTGKPPPQGAFLLGVPQGMRVEELQ